MWILFQMQKDETIEFDMPEGIMKCNLDEKKSQFKAGKKKGEGHNDWGQQIVN